MTRTKPKKMKQSKYSDAPRYKVIYGYEDDFKDSFKQILGIAIKDIEKTMKKMILKK